MNLEEFPEGVKKDIEDQSLSILEVIKDDIMVIGGWAVRALAGASHARYTLDIDGIADERDLPAITKKLNHVGLKSRVSDWGTQFFQKYEPKSKIVDQQVLERVTEVELRIEVSKPKIKELQTHHYFEFNLKDHLIKNIPFHNKKGSINIKVPPVESMAAVKLGLPVDYKNNYDSAVLLQLCDIEKVIFTIKNNDDWYELVLRRIPKLKGRITNPVRLENILLINTRINIKDHIRKLEYIQNSLKKLI
jgi:hypothetical protein